MLKTSVTTRPVTPNSNVEKANSHWSSFVYECIVSLSPNALPNLTVTGGSDNGEFAYFGNIQREINYVKGRAEEGDIILEVLGQKVAGYTQRDTVAWLSHCCRNGSPVTIRAVRNGCLTRDLRQYLNARFQKGSLDHDLQNTIRDNLYLRTVPCTTRLPREGEVNGVDYTFLSADEFVALEKSGNLLESGIYEDNLYGTPRPLPNSSALSLSFEPSSLYKREHNHYGTPKPPKETTSQQRGVAVILPGAHPSSEGKRRRNRSNVEAMASKSVDPEDHHHQNLSRSSTPSQLSNRRILGEVDNLGPLPENWEKAYTETGEPYFIDHSSGNSQWLDPRLARVQKKSIEDCDEDELPYGWERIDDPHYGTYYIDHVNRRTQYENPVLQARRKNQSSEISNVKNFWNVRDADPAPSTANSSGSTLPVGYEEDTPLPAKSCIMTGNYGGLPDDGEDYRVLQSMNHSWNRQNSHAKNEGPNAHPNNSSSQVTSNTNTLPVASSRHRPYRFTRDPEELQGEMIGTRLCKSTRGFGFTIVGGDDAGSEEFLQIKSVVPNGPACNDGKLKTGDVLVYVDETCVLGFSHQDMVQLFQSLPPDQSVLLEVCRGYPLPFDPEDPNNEIVTTMAVQADDGNAIYGGSPGNGASGEALGRTAKSMPDLSVRHSDGSKPQRHNSADLLSNGNTTPDILDFGGPQSPSKAEYLTVEIVKGTAGFGFTIADSAYGQKVKKILDRPRCKFLQEGDILVKLNQQDVRGLTHADVVQVLKDCPCGDEAHITVQRGGGGSPSKNKGKSTKTKSVEGRKSSTSLSTSLQFPEETHHSQGYLPPLRGAYRSKTPTADLYSSKEKESVSFSRPKTPLVDTRNWAQTVELQPTSASSSRSHEPSNDGPSYSRLPKSGDNGMFDSRPSDEGVWFPELGRTKEHPWLSRSFRDTTLQRGSDRFAGFNARSSDSRLRELYAKENRVHNRSPMEMNGFYSADPYLPESDWRHKGCGPWLPDRTGNVNSPFYSYFSDGNRFSNYDSGPAMSVGQPSASHFHPPESSSGYYTAVSPHPSNTSLSSQYDSLSRRKHSTSFEHEQPITSLMGQFPKEMNQLPSPYGLQPKVPTTATTVEMTVTLLRQENGFGFRILGGTEEGSQVSIGHIVPNGAAALDGRLHSNDEIVSVDGQSVINSSHHHVVQLMGAAAHSGKVTLGIRRKLLAFDPLFPSKSPEVMYPYDVTVIRKENEGFGFVIISSVSRVGSTIGRIIDGSPADRCGQLHVGDRILAVNGVSILNMHHGEIVNLIKDSGFSVVLAIGAPQDDGSSTASISQKGEDQSLEHDEHYYAVELHRGLRGFGFSIRGGREFDNMPLFVLRIAENGPAHQDHRLQVGDQIIEINGMNTKNVTHTEAIEIIKQGGNSVRLLVKRGNKMAIAEHPMTPTGSLGTPLSATGSLGTPLSAGSSILNGPICQSSPRDAVNYDMWNYETR